VRFLLEAGTNVNLRCYCFHEYDITPLILASVCGLPAVVALLLDHGANTELPCSSGLLPLMRAVLAGHKDVAKLLLNAGASGTKPHEGTYPIHIAASNYDTAMIQLLLSYVDHSSFDDIGQTALHLSIKKRTSDAEDGVYNEDGVRMLLEAGADPNCSDNFMRSPIHIAAQRGLLGAVQVLLKFVAYPVISSIYHRTPAVLARANGFENVALVLESAASEQLNILGFRWWF